MIFISNHGINLDIKSWNKLGNFLVGIDFPNGPARLGTADLFGLNFFNEIFVHVPRTKVVVVLVVEVVDIKVTRSKLARWTHKVSHTSKNQKHKGKEKESMIIYVYIFIILYIYINIPGTCLSSILGRQPSKRRPFPLKNSGLLGSRYK